MAAGGTTTATSSAGAYVAPSPHLSGVSSQTRWMMLDVLIALAPAVAVSLYVFQQYVVLQAVVCIVTCVAAEALFTALRGKPLSIGDGSAAVTGLILALSLPALAPLHVAVLGSLAAIGLGKFAFGGLGQNLFNPAMVGRAFVMLSFAAALGSGTYTPLGDESAGLPDALSAATPLTMAKAEVKAVLAGEATWDATRSEVTENAPVGSLMIGTINGSLGETSGWAILIGGIFLCLRRSAAWRIPVSVMIGGVFMAQLMYWAGLTAFNGIEHLAAGSLLFGAFFIATDPVSSPVTLKGQVVFGLGIGVLTIFIRTLSSYAEGVMFAVLLMNAATPLINRWTMPTPLGGPAYRPEAA
jgi:electron transport complex protein RnfD